jgi:FKBP-type peptidyl-prolyl cis-trans isomerase FkpA
MKKNALSLLVLVLVIASCKKETAAVCNFQPVSAFAPIAEKDSLQRYLLAHNIYNTTRDTTGVFYTITAPGTGTVTPALCSYLTTNYGGYLLENGSSFTNGVIPGSFTLGDLIPAWQKVLPLIKTGGSVTMYIPPSLAYGSTPRYNASGVVVIPANSYLKFTVEITDIQ